MWHQRTRITADRRPAPRRRVRALTAAAVVLVATACGSAAAGEQGVESGSPAAPSAHTSADHGSASGASATGPSSTTSPAGGSSSASTTAPPDGVINALTATGPVTADEVPDMQPVIDDPQPTLPSTVTDSRGTTITVTAARRVIALDLYGTLTDTIIGLGLTDRLVGRGVSDTQAALQDLPVVSLGGIELNVEAVLDLRPDVILTNMTIGSAENYQQLEDAGVTVVRFQQVPTIADIPATIHQVGAVFGMAKQADQLAAHTEKQLAAARDEIAQLRVDTPRKPRAVVIYVRGSGGIFFIFGADYGVSDVLGELGLDDVATDAGIASLVPANPESLVSLNPEIVLTMKDGLETAGGVQGLLGRAGMAATTAGANRRIIVAADSQLLSYGPRTPANLIALAKAIYTDG